jgi:hypothetical protein
VRARGPIFVYVCGARTHTHTRTHAFVEECVRVHGVIFEYVQTLGLGSNIML